MRAIILAAGMGTRLRPITLTTPKSLIKIGEETLIERQIRFLKEKGIDPFGERYEITHHYRLFG